MVMARAGFQGNWRIVMSSTFHLEYYTILHNVYIQLNPANFHFANLTRDYIYIPVLVLLSPP